MPDSNRTTSQRNDHTPRADTARQAVDSLRGYAYQIIATTLAWVNNDEDSCIFIEVAEDYATIVNNVLHAVQIKDTKASGSITLRNPNVEKALLSFVDLTKQNQNLKVEMHFLSTSNITMEHRIADRPAGEKGLAYWTKAAAGADISPLRSLLESDLYPREIQDYCKARSDTRLRSELLQRIHWDCGQPDIQLLRQELEDRLIVIGRDGFNLPSGDIIPIVDQLLYRVLEQSIKPNPQDRILTKAFLYRVIDAATHLSVPRAQLISLLNTDRRSLTLTPTIIQDHILQIRPESSWIVDGTTLPTLEGFIDRKDINDRVKYALKNYGVALLTGSSGTGKYLISKIVARTQSDSFVVANFRNSESVETTALLSTLFSHIGSLPTYSLLILDDINQMANVNVRSALSRIIAAAQRRFIRVILTCHRRPSINIMSDLQLGLDCIIPCTYFTQQDADELVSIHGGEPTVWGRVAYVSGGFGHPQLTHAFVIRMKLQGWQTSALQIGATIEPQSEDTEAVREEARRALVDELPSEARDLLYRLSLLVGGFDRPIALEVAEISPSISFPGEALDQLVGPWIEAEAQDRLRVSPLVSNMGQQMLPMSKQMIIHRSVAAAWLNRSSVDPADIDAILFHALRGDSQADLSTLAHLILSSDYETLSIVARHALSFRFFSTEHLIYPKDVLTSISLRLAQFAVLSQEIKDSEVLISRVVEALLQESYRVQDGRDRDYIRCLILVMVLNTIGIAGCLENWVDMLLEIEELARSDEDLQQTIMAAEKFAGEEDVVAAMFVIGGGRLSNTDSLLRIVRQLDEIPYNQRERLMSSMVTSPGGIAAFVNGPWIAMRHKEPFDALATAEAYGEVANIAGNWQEHELSVQASIAQAVLLDEFADERAGAEMVLLAAQNTFGPHIALRESLAAMSLRHGDFEAALRLYEQVAGEVDRDDHIEGGYALRRAAIAAAQCEKWKMAARWFSEAQVCFEGLDTVMAHTMVAGLGTDAAVAELKAGHLSQSLKRLVDAASILANIDPTDSLQAAHCHRVFRHTVLWCKSRIEQIDINVDGQPIEIVAGGCSNPDPSPKITDLPLGHLDLAWYMMAELEIIANGNCNLADDLPTRLSGESIPLLELSLGVRRMGKAILELDAEEFSNQLERHVSTSMYVIQNRDSLVQDKDFVINPKRAVIPNVALYRTRDVQQNETARAAILAFCLQCIFEDRIYEINHLNQILTQKFSTPFSGEEVFRKIEKSPGSESDLVSSVLGFAGIYVRGEQDDARNFWMASLRFLEWTVQSYHKEILLKGLANWVEKGWRGIITMRAFLLRTPRLSVPTIEDALRDAEATVGFIVQILIATASAAGIKLESDYKAKLEGMAHEQTQSTVAPK